jgi:hypothetical protein
MREVKFRGWTIEDGDLVKGQLGEDNYGNPRIQQGDRIIEYVVPETIGQYLGIKDMAGNEVFEGDILKEESGSKARISDGKKFPQYSSKTIEILFKDGNFKERVIAHENSYFGKIPSKPVDVTSWIIAKAFKIIGNIHTPTNA